MPFETTSEDFLRFLPNYLTREDKDRLADALEQFKVEKSQAWNSKLLTHFYSRNPFDYFLQGDLLRQIRYANWNAESKSFDKIYLNAIILSNTCDLDLSNQRNITKEVVLAPLTEFRRYKQKLEMRIGSGEKLKSLEDGIKAQVYSSLLYLPPAPGTTDDFVCHLDKAFWFPTEELNSYLPDLSQTRISSLDYFGYYLFLVKLSYHFCRLPEEKQR
ncbi:MAG: hypothetical protein AAB316_15160 [Bacteroidota bacterium]